MSIIGLRKNLSFETAAKLVDKGDFVLGGLEYPATKIIRSPLFQKLAGEIDQTATTHTIKRIEETQRIENIQRVAMDQGVSKTDLQALMEQIARIPQGPPGQPGQPGQPG